MNMLAGTLLLVILHADGRLGASARPVAKAAVVEKMAPRDIAAAKRRQRMRRRDGEIDRMMKQKK